jgi:crotonobetainyl-CoA:carnitine CoA-transferase CaiB-like acyl-CoA transferase
MGLNHPTIAPYGIYRAGDGGAVVISIQNEREWARFRDQVVARPDLADDQRFADNTARVANRPALDAILAEAFKPLTRDQLVERLRAAQIAYGALNGVAELLRHPQLRRAAVETAFGAIDLVAPPARVTGDTAAFGRVPEIGAHSDTIRREFAT